MHLPRALALLLFGLTVQNCASNPSIERQIAKASCTKYPIVLHHGFLSGRGLHWPGAQESLRKHGCNVFSTEVVSAQSIPVRGRQFAEQLAKIRHDTGAVKVNIIAHSMGGLDARYSISSLGEEDHVASLSTISTPHRGTPLASRVFEKRGELGGQILTLLMEIMARLANGSTTFAKVDVMAAISSLNEDYMEGEFNRENRDRPKVYYQSWGGKAVKSRHNLINSLLMDSYDIVYESRGENDGMVPVSSSAWGVFRGILEADHLSLAGHAFDRARTNSFDQNQFLIGVVDELKLKGL